jgi:RNA polymerase sigma-70 factor (ECF subfamily)
MVRGEESAYRRFYDLYFDRLLRYLLVVTRNEEAAREALQATFLRVVRYVRRFDSEEAFWSWLTVLARSSLADEHRKGRRYLNSLIRFFEHSQVASPPLDTDQYLREVLQATIDTLPPDERDLIHQMYFEHKSVRQIGSETQLSEKAVESRLSRIRQKLKDLTLTRLRHEP